MLDSLIRRDDVTKILVDICNSVKYGEKKPSRVRGCRMYSAVDQLLYLFYEALFKYTIIIEDMDYFPDFLEQVDKLVRKIDNIDDIQLGIDRIIGRICALKLECKDISDEKSKEILLKYVYKKYYTDGFYIHGYNQHYCGSILEHGFKTEEYENLYDKFKKVQAILKDKKHEMIITKDFNRKEVSFTDSFLLGCYYSENAPMFFSRLLCQNDFIAEGMAIDAYLKKDYETCLKNLNKVISGLELSDSQKKVFVDAFKSEWKLLDRNNNIGISLMLVPAKLVSNFDIADFIKENKDEDFLEAVCKLLERKDTVVVSRNFSNDDITLINLPSCSKYVKEEKKRTLTGELEKTFIKNDDDFAFTNTYGKVSILVLVGVLLITAGVILTILMLD